MSNSNVPELVFDRGQGRERRAWRSAPSGGAALGTASAGSPDSSRNVLEGSDGAGMWVKLADPGAALSLPTQGTEMRAILPLEPAFDTQAESLESSGAEVRRVKYWVEHEHAFSQASRDAFDLMWQAHAKNAREDSTAVPAEELLPAPYLPYLPFPTLNPAQVQAVPTLLDADGHIVVVAPTGAGKTAIGMVAALQAVLEGRGKAAWLVPQRSLTDELDRELDAWRSHGLRVERLSGEYAVDAEKLREADLWVATTEKFESVCRTGTLRDAIEGVAALVVDEIHLLGDPVRGPVLEALLARVRQTTESMRIVGLSATVANANEIAEWLGAQLVTTQWRPTRLTWQLPTIASAGDYKSSVAARTRKSTELAARITADGGSVLIFAGSKRNVRATALAIAASRGVSTAGVDPDDAMRVYEVCHTARVGLHYRDWERKAQAEAAFRSRDYDVLVATTTVAAGVNLPARAVIVRDTQIGLDQLGVATVLQMFGRAGRIGAGETEGWAFLIVEEAERPRWQARLAAGYTVRSQITESLPDHVLAELVQERITTRRGARAWWVETLAFHQGERSLDLVDEAVDFLAQGGYLTVAEGQYGDAALATTDLGVLTARLMIPTVIGLDLREHLADALVPEEPRAAEWALISALAECVPQFSEAPVAENLRPLVFRLAKDRSAFADDSGFDTANGPVGPGDLAKATLQLLIDRPQAFSAASRTVDGLPVTVMYPILEEAPRYLAWLAGQGALGAVHPWVAVVAGDLARRITWRGLGPRRGGGRLLWMLEQMATPVYAKYAVPDLWRAARSRGHVGPDWPLGPAPRGCRLDQGAYVRLLQDRATGTRFTRVAPASVEIDAPAGAIATVWSGQAVSTSVAEGTPFIVELPENEKHSGAVVFTRRGDFHAFGWLEAFTRISGDEDG